jgi:hypothetical protein
MEWVATIAKKPQSDAVLKKLRPAFKTLNNLLDRIFADNKFEMTSTEILLMAIVIMLLFLYMKPSAPVQVNITPQPQPKTDNKEHEQ